MSSPQFPDDPNTPQQPATPQPATPQPGWPTDTGAAPTTPPDYPPSAPQAAYPPGAYPPGAYPTSPGQYPPPVYPSAPDQYSPGTYPPAPGQYPPPVLPYYGPPSVPLQPGQEGYPPAPPGVYPAPPSAPLQPGYYAPPSMPLPGYGAPPTIPLPGGYGAPAPVSQYGMPVAPPVPQIEPTPAIRQGFLIAGIGGAVAFVAYFILPYVSVGDISRAAVDSTSLHGALWLVLLLSAFVGVLGFIPAARNRAYGTQTPRNGAIAAIAASGFGVLLLFSAMEGGIGFWIMLLGLIAGIVGGVLVFRETQPTASDASHAMSLKLTQAPPSTPLQDSYAAPSSAPAPREASEPTAQAGAPTQMPPSSPAIQAATDSAKPAPRQTLSKPGQAGKHGTANPALGIIGLILVFIVEGWSLIYKIALVILVIVGIVFFINEHVGLNEHSSCQQFEQADSGAQNQVLQDMMNAHHDQGSITTARFSVTLYCNIYGGSAPIDGIYGSGNVGQQPAQVLLLRHP